MSTLSVAIIRDVQSFDFSNTEFAKAYNVSNAAFDQSNAASVSANASYAVQNASFAVTNTAYASVNSNWTVTNTVYGVANAAFASANNVAPQVTPAFLTANLAYTTANAAFASANNVAPQLAPAYNTANLAFNAANNVGPQIAPAFNTANAAFGKANTALQNTSGVSFNGNFYVPSGNVGIGTSSPSQKLHVAGIGFASTDFRSPIFYDSDNTAYYVDPASTSYLNAAYFIGSIASGTLAADYNSAAIEVREYNFAGPQTDSWSYAPRIGFHWGGRVASQIAMRYNGRITILNNPGTDYEAFECGNLYANFPTLFQTSTQATTSTDRSLGFSTSWTNHLSVTFTTTRAGPIYAGTVLAMSYESAAVQGEAQFVLSGAASMTSQYMAVAQQSDANKARGAHSMTWMFGNCPAGSYTLTLQVRNNGSGSTWILNNYLGFDTLYTSYM